MKNTDLLTKLKERHACKAMNGKKIAEDKINRILEAIRLAPTSSGLQPFEVFVITNQELKKKIQPIAFNQPQITECSHLLVFAAWDTYTEERINYMFDLTNEVREFTNEGWENYRNHLLSTYPKQEAEINFIHASRQTYIAFMAAIAQAAYEEVDCTPMEGFNANALDEVLDLKNKGLRSTLLLPLGYSHEEKDWLSKMKKVRKPMEKIVTILD